MTGRLVVFVICMGLACYGAYQFDRRVMEPSLSRAAAKALGCTVIEYRTSRSNFWRVLRRRLTGRRA